MKRRTMIAGVLASASAGPMGVARAQAPSPGKEIKIGFMSAASGPAAFIGASERSTFELLVGEYNAAGGFGGRRIVPVMYDTEGNSTVAAQQFRRLAESDQVSLIIGPSTTGEAVILRIIAEEIGIPMISMTGTEAIVVPPTPHVFKVAPTDRTVSAQMLDFAKSKGWSNIGIITSADGFGQAGATYLKANAEKAGVKIVVAEEFGPRDTDMTPQVLRLRRAPIDVMMIWSVNPGPTIILRNAAAASFNKPIVNSFGVASPLLLDQAGRAAEGTYVSTMRLLVPDELSENDPLRAVVLKLATDYRTRFNSPVTTFAGHAHDALKLVQLALEKIDGEPTRANITAALGSDIKFPGCNGMMHYTAENHGGQDENSNAMVMAQIKSNKFVLAS